MTEEMPECAYPQKGEISQWRVFIGEVIQLGFSIFSAFLYLAESAFRARVRKCDLRIRFEYFTAFFALINRRYFDNRLFETVKIYTMTACFYFVVWVAFSSEFKTEVVKTYQNIAAYTAF